MAARIPSSILTDTRVTSPSAKLPFATNCTHSKPGSWLPFPRLAQATSHLHCLRELPLTWVELCVKVGRAPQHRPLRSVVTKDRQRHVPLLHDIQQFHRAGAKLLLAFVLRTRLSLRREP